ncbi:hypothetical protein CW304_08935 [Bacillus sp. UFRGS-B20]|nr:hypothetical protein CW304_08935 [Bacillus sp. UFRGS-B20]
MSNCDKAGGKAFRSSQVSFFPNSSSIPLFSKSLFITVHDSLRVIGFFDYRFSGWGCQFVLLSRATVMVAHSLLRWLQAARLFTAVLLVLLQCQSLKRCPA